jgi:tetratricopeptide (TPR) repeat protein
MEDAQVTTLDERLDEARLLLGLDRLDEAEELLLGALNTAEATGDAAAVRRASEGLGQVAAQRGTSGRAIEMLERAIAAAGRPDPADSFDLYTTLARVYSESGRAQEAVELLAACLEELRGRPDPDPATVVRYAVMLSYAHADAGDYGRAATALSRVLRDDAEEIDAGVRTIAYYAFARLYSSTGHTAQALEYADRCVELADRGASDDMRGSAHLLRGHILLDAGHPTAAAAALAQARRAYGAIGPADEGFLAVEEARLLLQTGDAEGAAARALEAIATLSTLSAPGQLGDAHLVLARAQEALHRPEAAERAYEAAIDSLRRQNGWHCELGRAYRWYGKFLRSAGRAQAAMDALERAADLAPSNLAGPA